MSKTTTTRKRTVRIPAEIYLDIPAGANAQTVLEKWLNNTALEDGVQVPSYLVSQSNGVSNMRLFVSEQDVAAVKEENDHAAV